MSYSWGIISGAFLAPYLLILYWKGLNRAGAWAGMIGGFLTAFLPAALSGFTTSNGPLYACLAMAVSFLLCFVVSHIARKCGWTSGQNDDSFYQLKVEENEWWENASPKATCVYGIAGAAWQFPIVVGAEPRPEFIVKWHQTSTEVLLWRIEEWESFLWYFMGKIIFDDCACGGCCKIPTLVSPLIQNERVWSPKEFRECTDSFFVSRIFHKAEKSEIFLISRSLILLHRSKTNEKSEIFLISPAKKLLHRFKTNEKSGVFLISPTERWLLIYFATAFWLYSKLILI